jgi:hypothetical protein
MADPKRVTLTGTPVTTTICFTNASRRIAGLFRSSDPDRIAANVCAAAASDFNPEQLDRFEALGAELSRLPVA